MDAEASAETMPSPQEIIRKLELQAQEHYDAGCAQGRSRQHPQTGAGRHRQRPQVRPGELLRRAAAGA